MIYDFLITFCLKLIVVFLHLKISKNCILRSNNKFLSIKLSKPSVTKLEPVFLALEWHKNLQKWLRNSEDISSEREGCQRATLHEGFIPWTLHYWEKKTRLRIIELRILHMDLYYAIVLLFTIQFNSIQFNSIQFYFILQHNINEYKFAKALTKFDIIIKYFHINQ